MFQTFRPIDGVLSSFGHKKRTLKEAIAQARTYKGSEIRVWGTLTAVWWDGKLLPEALEPSFKPQLVRVRTVSIMTRAGGTLKAEIRAPAPAPVKPTRKESIANAYRRWKIAQPAQASSVVRAYSRT